jgi:hypothetical protein
VLSSDEYTAARRRLQREYFGFLGVEALYNFDPALWQFTRGGLATIGESFSGWRRVRWMLAGVLHILGHPRKLFRFVARKLSQRGRRG